ncbi:MAG: hypothetical protein EA355_14635 [Rhodobacteraceae bacterium]|nr:MAG: hypothetical protein EA355_14635 [Paracoccaceae bacterium]
MTGDKPPSPHEDMAAILASIRRIVADEDKRATPPPLLQEDVLELTPDMRVLDAPAATALDIETDELELSLDEAQIADIARAVLREEFAGDFGRDLTRKLRVLVREEVAQAVDALNERR